MKRTVLAIISGVLALSLGAQQPVAIKNNLPPLGDGNAFIISGYNAALMDIEDNAPRKPFSSFINITAQANHTRRYVYERRKRLARCT